MLVTRPIVVLDRDGTLIHNNQSIKNGPYYVTDPKQIRIKEGVVEGLMLLSQQPVNAMFRVITKQNCIPKALATREQVFSVNKTLVEMLPALISHCVFRVYWGSGDAVSASLAILSNILYDMDAPMAQGKVVQSERAVWIIDDSQARLEAAKELGLKTILISNPFSQSTILVDAGSNMDDPDVLWADYMAADFLEAAAIIKRSTYPC